MKAINAPSDINVSRILRRIWQKQGISRSQLASALGIDKSTVTKIVAALLDSSIVREFAQGEAGPQGGRKPVFLEIAPSFACVGGIELNAERITCCLLDLRGTLLFRYEQLRKGFDLNTTFLHAVEVLSFEARRLKIPLVGLGTGMPGIIDADNGVVLCSIPLKIEQRFEFAQFFSAKCGLPVYTENDARCCCYGERMLVFDQGVSNELFLLVEIRSNHSEPVPGRNLSVGMGLVINGSIHRGSNFFAGEFRSILSDAGGCSQFSSEGILSASDTNESDSNDLYPYFQELARNVAFLVNTLNLEKVYIGGVSERRSSELAAVISERVKLQWPYQMLKGTECRIVQSSLGDFAVAYGAASMFIDRLFSLPSVDSPSDGGPSVLESITRLHKTSVSA